MFLHRNGVSRERREFLRLGAVASGLVALGGVEPRGRGIAAAQTFAVPTVDRLVLTNVVDNICARAAAATRGVAVEGPRTAVPSTGVACPRTRRWRTYKLA
jgi:hypothetical protein